MNLNRSAKWLYLATVLLGAGMLQAGTARAQATDAEKCAAAKMKSAGKYSACRLKADAKAEGTATVADYSKCETKQSAIWTKIEAKFGSDCPTSGDQAAIQAAVTSVTECLAADLRGIPAACDVMTVQGDLDTCTSDLGTCNGNLGTCNGDLGTCSADLATCNAGTATAADVIAGKTFSGSAGLGATGTMPDNGAVTLTPTTTDQAIAEGYHSGSGKCAGDPDLLAANIASGVNLFGVAGTARTSRPLKTGQTQCDEGSTIGSCPGTPVGQDGMLQIGATRSYTDNGDGTITDNRTGLQWEKMSRDGSVHDMVNQYSWDDAFNVKVATLNVTNFAGYNDWRVPNVNELQTLVDYGRANPSIDPIFNTTCVFGCTVDGIGGPMCSCTPTTSTWTSTTSILDGVDRGIFVAFNSGYVYSEFKSNMRSVRAVRGGL